MERYYIEHGETIIHNGVRFKVVKDENESPNCKECCFVNDSECLSFECAKEFRMDGVNVVFVKLGILPFEVIRIAEHKYMEYSDACSSVAKEAQKYIDWDDNIGCEYFPSDGVCLTTSEAKVCPADSFFEAVKDKDRISQNDFEKLCI